MIDSSNVAKKVSGARTRKAVGGSLLGPQGWARRAPEGSHPSRTYGVSCSVARAAPCVTPCERWNTSAKWEAGPEGLPVFSLLQILEKIERALDQTGGLETGGGLRVGIPPRRAPVLDAGQGDRAWRRGGGEVEAG